MTAAEITPPEAKVLEPTAPKANAVRRFLAIPAGLAGIIGLLLILASYRVARHFGFNVAPGRGAV